MNTRIAMMLPLKAELVVSVTKDPNIEGIRELLALIEELVSNDEDLLDCFVESIVLYTEK